MEFVGGKSLKNILKTRMTANGGVYDPLPVDQAIAYVLEVLPAFQYLHDLDLLYCDFKPDNLIQAGDAVKLIDLGGVRRVDDMDSAIYGTVGYQAPEVAEVGPSVASDIYTIGRTLVSLATEFRGNTSHVRRAPAAGRRRPAVPALRLVLPAAGSRPARATPTTGSRRPTSCACSCSACCARSSRPTAGGDRPARALDGVRAVRGAASSRATR